MIFVAALLPVALPVFRSGRTLLSHPTRAFARSGDRDVVREFVSAHRPAVVSSGVLTGLLSSEQHSK